ncbi:MAG: TonB-dependent receptor, partial [Candidatus Zixiibacteriota bacterium]
MKRFYWALVMFAFGASGIKANIETPEEKSPKVLSDSIVVTANRFGLTPQNSVWPTTLINHQTLKNHSSLQAVLDGKAGIDVRSYNGDGSLSTLSNWGLFNRHMLLLYNGRAVKDYSLGGFNLSEYSIDEIDRIEILKGPQSAFYGSDAVGGVVNLITNNSMVDRLELTTKQGSFNLKHYHLNMTKKINQFSLGGYAEFSETDNHRNNAGTTRYLLKLQTNYFSSDGRHYVSLSTRYFNDSLGVPGPEPDNNFIPVYGNEESYSLYDHQKDENYSFDFQYRFDDKKIGTAQVDLFREKKKLDYNSLYNYQSFYYTFDSTMSPPDSFLNIDSVDVNSRSVYNKRSSGISGRFLKQWSSLHFAGGVDWLSGSIR